MLRELLCAFVILNLLQMSFCDTGVRVRINDKVYQLTFER